MPAKTELNITKATIRKSVEKSGASQIGLTAYLELNRIADEAMVAAGKHALANNRNRVDARDVSTLTVVDKSRFKEMDKRLKYLEYKESLNDDE